MRDPKVVVVEDEADIREVLEHNLTREGFQVYSAADGEKGLRLVKEKLPDLVLLDLMLPGLDGLDVCRKMKADPETSSIAIVMVTAKGEESDIVLGLGVGADDYVSKPFSPKELIARVKAVLRRGPLKERESSPDRIGDFYAHRAAAAPFPGLPSRPSIYTRASFEPDHRRGRVCD